MLSESNLDCPVLPDVNAKASSWTWQRHLVVRFCRASDLLHWSCPPRSVRLQNDPPIGREFVVFVGVAFGDDQKHSVKIFIQRYPEEIWFSQASSAYSPIDVKHLGSNQLDGYWTTYQPPGTVMHDGMNFIEILLGVVIEMATNSHHVVQPWEKHIVKKNGVCRTLDGGPWQVFLSRQSQFQNWLHTESRTTKAQHVGHTFSQLLPADSWQRRLKNSMYLSSNWV